MYKPIIFNTENVRAILDGNKTATRRTIKPKSAITEEYPVPPYSVGDVLWVRETFSVYTQHGEDIYIYKTHDRNRKMANNHKCKNCGYYQRLRGNEDAEHKN